MIGTLLLALIPCHTDLTEIPSPAGEGARFPELVRGADGVVYLAWTEPAGDGHALGVAVLEDGVWQRRNDAASGEGWFVNWADFPTLAALADGTLAATFLRKSDDGTYTYDACAVLSGDGGRAWGAPFVIHDDRRPAEHGFVSLLPLDERSFAVFWLDGRETAGGHGAVWPGAGAMTLRGRTITPIAAKDGEAGVKPGVELGEEVLLDDRVCDCCQTSAVRGPEGEVWVAWRDRSEDEVRDVSVARWRDGRVVGAKTLHADGWRIPGCPVNGPALDAVSGRAGAAWFTMGTDAVPRVLAALTRADGEFGAPIRVAAGRPIGRVDGAFASDGSLWVTWLDPEAEGDGGVWRVRSIDADGELRAVEDLVRVSSAGRDAGFGRLLADGERLLFAWTEPGPTPRIRTASIPRGR